MIQVGTLLKKIDIELKEINSTCEDTSASYYLIATNTISGSERDTLRELSAKGIESVVTKLNYIEEDL